MKYTCFFILSLFLSVVLYSQNTPSVKQKYVVVKSSLDFLKQTDRYQTSSFTKFLFNKAGFDTYLDNEELPEELIINRCNALFADVKDKSGIFITKNYIELSDCRGKIVYSSMNGSSKLKDFEKAYRQSIRSAFSTIERLDSVYNSSVLAAIQPNKIELVQNIQGTKDNKNILTASLNQKKMPDHPLLYAQKIDIGYQLVNVDPAIVFILLNTNDKNKFIIQDKNGTFVKSGDFWVAEYYDDDKLITEIYHVKF